MNHFDPIFIQAELILKFLRNELTVAEKAELDTWLSEGEANRKLFNELTDEATVQSEINLMEQFPANGAWEVIAAKTVHAPKPVNSIRKMQPWYFMAAAAFLLIASVTVFQLWNKQTVKTESVKTELEKASSIAPGTNKALLTIADGSVIEIGEASNGLLSKQNNVDLLVNDGEISYKPNGKDEEVLFNTITTPKGGQYRLVLADGTKVWLNAASSLKYPTAFIGNERNVELQGEGYFEVAHNASKPFKVLIEGKGAVTALGTQFNINSYADESFTKTTLIEGKVKVSSGNDVVVLMPNQQARIPEAGKIYFEAGVDTEEVIAWKNGRFIFKSANIEHIMKQIARWYDIEVTYKNKNNEDKFSGIVSRSGNLSDVLRIMSEGGVKFKVDEKNIIVY